MRRFLAMLVVFTAIMVAPTAVVQVADGHVGGGCCFITFIGHDHEDYATGHSGNSYLEGRGGADRLFGGDGDDLIYGMKGNDLIDGGPGIDRCYGGLNADTFRNCEYIFPN